jgi:hypothetical protein
MALDDIIERPLQRRDVDMTSDTQARDDREPVTERAVQVTLI